MRSFLIKRILQAVSVVVCISALTFFVLNIVPGDPVRVMMGDMADEATVQQVRHTMGLDKPIPKRYANTAKRSVTPKALVRSAMTGRF